MNWKKILYWIFTVLLALTSIGAGAMYIADLKGMQENISVLGFPTYLVLPLAIAKILAGIVIVSRKNKMLLEWAYAGLFFVFLLAFGAHLTIGDGAHWPPLIAIFILLGSYFLGKMIYVNE